MNNFSNVGLLITHFNRSKSLENLLDTLARLKCTFREVVVSDDGSDTHHMEHIEYLKSIYSFDLLKSSRNQGLGHNINKGQDEILADYTLYIQEDFEPTEFFADALRSALTRMDINKSLDIVRLWAYFSYPYLGSVDTDGFAEMVPKLWGAKYNKIYCYSDNPHLRRTSFFHKFGRYEEGLSGDETEYKMCLSFLCNRGRGLFYVDSLQLFKHRNTFDEPSTMGRPDWTRSRTFFIRIIRAVYKQLRFNYDIHVRGYKLISKDD